MQCEFCGSKALETVSNSLVNFSCGSYIIKESKLDYRTEECKERQLKRRFGSDLKAVRLATTQKCSTCDGSGYTGMYHTVDNTCYSCGGQGSVIGSKISLDELKFLLERV